MTAKKNADDKESEVWSAISAFEQILEAMPNDRTLIESLAHAYEQIGDLTRAKDYLIRLADVIIAEADIEATGPVIEKLHLYAAEDDSAKAALTRLNVFAEKTPRAATPTTEEHPAKEETQETKAQEGAGPARSASAAGISNSFNIANELPFAWNLLQTNELTQEEYANVIQDLTDMSTTEAFVTVSVLHVLHDRGHRALGRILAKVSKECGTPVLSLASFTLQPEAFSLLPLEFMVRRGVMTFDMIGRDALVVIMNPYDKQTMKDVETLSGRECHFFMTPPAEFDAAIQSVNNWFKNSGSGA